jgi:hypothetical protein
MPAAEDEKRPNWPISNHLSVYGVTGIEHHSAKTLSFIFRCCDHRPKLKYTNTDLIVNG